MKPKIVLLQSALVAFVSLVRPETGHGGRPLVVDDAAPVAPGGLEVELGLYHGRPDGGGRDRRWPTVAVAYGLVEGLEIGLGLQRVSQDMSGASPVDGFEDLRLAAKYRIAESRGRLPSIAAAVDVKLPTASRSRGLSSGKSDQTLLAIATQPFGAFAVHANIGYTIVGRVHGKTLMNRIHGGAAVEHALDSRWLIVGEIFGFSRPSSATPNEAEFQVGVRYALHPSLVLDAAAGRSLRPRGTMAQATFGLTWTFDLSGKRGP
ncbi:MAG TPA: transporter [candidate division Zixibacteria bacterium]|nr:transporter [candidate division Zixibacteria bacterium]